ncbi:transglutaminase-like cysteine peptidase [Tsuneonella sp. YG55]|uniref:Transglutaminase-like cysteine peptidase n=1 Tax=Tsuneonella litorea TaxID=2976475 RepID=A0A9X2W1N4_9SPHN|nr:transglutaminase-like cysteine peptidase [Tsuneonella litorea]MCT2558914.1 transglutaminase-like cysteine peptidase [Tsuneonella litorea]
MRKGQNLRLPSSRRVVAGLSALALGSLAAPAQAAIPAIMLPAFVDGLSGCPISAQPLAPALAPPPALTKTAALLGGAPSALDAIRAQQAVLAPGPAAPATLLADATIDLPALTPGIDASAPLSPACAGLVASRASPLPGLGAPQATAPVGPDDFLASKRVRIGRTNFDRDWKRVRGETISAGQLKRTLGALPASTSDSLAAVNRWVNHRIAYTEDREQFGVADYWAGARKTLKSGKGDCEDIALTKMQLLAAAGVPRDAMILTIARDLVRNADHAVLIVRTEAGYRLLDNATDEVLDAAPQHDYRAILSFGDEGRWLHGV